MNSVEIYQVDAFTNQPFRGNPAAVCALKYPLDDMMYQNIANEMNLSETAFVVSEKGKDFSSSKIFNLRWFTPKTEVPMCGHATLATSWILFNEFNYKGKITFTTKSGLLKADLTAKGVRLDFPQDPPEEINISHSLLKVLNYNKKYRAFYGKKTGYILLELENEDDVYELNPDFGLLKNFSFNKNLRGLIVTSRSENKIDFVSRFFDPWEGIDEDPVTGSAHTVLGPFWNKKLGKNTLFAKQLSTRTGKLILQIRNDERIFIMGKAVTIMKGNLYF
ncbi:MAG: PhzF family phenazine biosynthesis protein [Kosmotogaceae bacterium]